MDKDPLPFMVAQLIDHFHLMPSQIGELTRYQIFNLYMWKRDEHGALVAPEGEKPIPKKMDDLEFLKMLRQKMPGKVKGIDERIKQLEEPR